MSVYVKESAKDMAEGLSNMETAMIFRAPCRSIMAPKKGDTNEPRETSESERPISVRLHPNSASRGPTKWPNEYCDPPTVTE